MNTNLNGKISFLEFHAFCKVNPSAIDVFCKVTLGPHPPPENFIPYPTSKMQYAIDQS